MSTENSRLEAMISALDQRVHKLEASMLLSAKDGEHLEEKLDGIIKRLDRNDANQSRIFWIVAGTAISFVVTFVFNGGFASAVGN